jgi:ribosomal protein L12E/L44/L45/RPP1/RPP2
VSLQNLGEFESVDRSGSTTYVSFRDRKTAEKLYHSLHGKELAGVEGKLDLQWVTGAPPPPSTAAAATAGTGTGGPSASKDEDEPMDEEDRSHAADMDYSEQRAEDEDAY